MHSCCNIASLTTPALSSTFFHTSACTQRRAPFRSSGRFCFSNHRLACNPFRVRCKSRSDPCISSIHNLDHDYYFELLREEEWNAQSIARCSTAHHRDIRAVPRVNWGLQPAKSHENDSVECRIEPARSSEIEFAVERLRRPRV